MTTSFKPKAKTAQARKIQKGKMAQGAAEAWQRKSGGMPPPQLMKKQKAYEKQKEKLLSSKEWAVASEAELRLVQEELDRADDERAREVVARAKEILEAQKEELIKDQLDSLQREQTLRRREFHEFPAAPWTKLQEEDGSARLEVWRDFGIAEVHAPAAGATNPVFFVLLKEPAGIVIFKFLSPGQSGRVFLGDKLLRQMGARTPSLRFVRRVDEELEAVLGAAAQSAEEEAEEAHKGVLDQKKWDHLPEECPECSVNAALLQTLKQLRDGQRWESLMIMEYCKGQMVDEYLCSVNADDPTAVEGVGKLFRQLGEMLVCDLLTHNYDRFYLPGVFDGDEGHRDKVRVRSAFTRPRPFALPNGFLLPPFPGVRVCPG